MLVGGGASGARTSVGSGAATTFAMLTTAICIDADVNDTDCPWGKTVGVPQAIV